MIRVTVDLESANGRQYDRGLFTMIIANDGSGSPKVGNYNIYLGRRGVTDATRIIRGPLRKGRVEGHRRKSTHVGSLIRKALASVNL